MSLETRSFNTVRGSLAYHISDYQSERLLTWTRFIVGFAFLVFLLMSYLLGRVETFALLVGLIMIGILFISNGYYLFRTRLGPSGTGTLFALVFLDITVISTVIWVYSFSSEKSLVPSLALFCAYFFIVIFTALHYRASLVLFGGIMSLVQYGAIFFWNVGRPPAGQRDFIFLFCVQMATLLLVSIISVLISRNNSRTIQRVFESEQRYQNLVHRLPELLFTMDKNGNILWANMASSHLFGVPANIIKNRNIKEFLREPSALSLGSGPFRTTLEIRDLNGKARFVDCALQPTNDKESATAWEGIMTDVTDKELAISQREEMVGRLFQYQKMESLGSLAGGMAHDFNHILQTISDMCAMIQKETAEDVTRKHAELLSEALVDARFLVSELLALGRKTPLDYRPVNIIDFLSRIMPGLQDPTGRNPFHLVLDLFREPLTILGDAEYLKRVFQNLTTNSVDAMGGVGTITVSCYSEAQKDDSRFVVIRFSDTGTGIRPENQAKIFDPFFTTKKPGRGTGLGLALVQRIITLHNGRIFVEKTDTSGTTFRIEFPQADSSGVEDTKVILSNRKHSRLLLLDDDRKIRDVLKFFLKEYGYEICEAQNLDEARNHLVKYKDTCDVLVMDWKLGTDDPRLVISTLRGIRNDLIVIVVSGYPADTDSVERLNISRWFTKPYEKSQLDIEIQRALYKAAHQSRSG